MPILEGIYINANNSTITLIGSDMMLVFKH